MTDIKLFDYHLPERLIAQRPAERRDLSRLMIVSRREGIITHARFTDFPGLLKSGDALAVNTTKVFPARLAAKRATGGAVELLLTRHAGGGVWEAMVRGLKKMKTGETIGIGNGKAVLIEKLGTGAALFRFASEEEARRIIGQSGAIPLPPYIRRPGGAPDAQDETRYQTVFAKDTGSCAAPTAGLHFTEDVLKTIRERGVTIVPVTLHVGPGTFRPVKTEEIESHVMDAEPFGISAEAAAAINEARGRGGRVVAVGSTVTRALESAAGEDGKIKPGEGKTSLYIRPGYRFRAVDALLTNFHLPKSTLLILVCAFAGRRLALKAYEQAVKEEYRFYSYGDAMFIE